MKSKFHILFTIQVILILSIFLNLKVNALSFDEKVNTKLSGGNIATKSMSIWKLHKYKSTKLMQKSPMCWCPWVSYSILDKYVYIKCKNNKYYLCIDANFKKILKPQASYNRKFAKSFKVSGGKYNQIKQIFNYCRKTKYVAHVKTAKQVFNTRTGDCAGIAAAFYVLCKAKNIPVRYVIGWDTDDCHAWNKVMLSKKWYWIDCTHNLWLSKRQFKKRHIMEIW